MKHSVAVIGAGITGLVAAYRLGKKNIPAVVYESSNRVGGVIRSIRQDGYLAEFGPNTILDTSPKIREVIKDSGLESRMMYSEDSAANRYLVRYRRTIAAPSTPIGFFTSDLFTWKAKLNLMVEPLIPRWNNSYEESVGQFVERRLGKEFLQYAIDALVGGVYAGDPYKLSVLHGFPKLYALEQKYGSMIKGQILGARERKRRAEVSKQDAKKISFDEGLQVLPDKMAQLLGNQVRLQTEVLKLRRVNEGWEITWRSQGMEQTELHSHVILCLPAFKMKNIRLEAGVSGGAVGTGESLGFDSLEGIHYPPVTTVVLGFRRKDVDHLLDGFGMLIPQVEGFNILGTLFSSSLFPNRAPEGCVTLTSYVGGMRNPGLAAKSPEELYSMVEKDLRILLGVTGPCTFKHHQLYSHAIPQYEVGYGKFKKLFDDIEKAAPGLVFAGHYRHGISISDSIVSGYDSVDKIIP